VKLSYNKQNRTSEVANCIAVSPDSFFPCRHSTTTALEFPDLSPELCGGAIRPLLEASDLLNFRTQLLLPQRSQNRCGSGFSPAFCEQALNLELPIDKQNFRQVSPLEDVM